MSDVRSKLAEQMDAIRRQEVERSRAATKAIVAAVGELMTQVEKIVTDRTAELEAKVASLKAGLSVSAEYAKEVLPVEGPPRPPGKPPAPPAAPEPDDRNPMSHGQERRMQIALALIAACGSGTGSIPDDIVRIDRAVMSPK